MLKWLTAAVAALVVLAILWLALAKAKKTAVAAPSWLDWWAVVGSPKGKETS